MASEELSLADLRREIDTIDDSLHDLVMLRAELVDAIRNQKIGDGLGIYRPAREAQVLRRLIARHKGEFPKKVLIRMWREMMSALVRMQGPFGVAVWESGAQAGFRHLASDHFGSETPLISQPSPHGVIQAVSAAEANVGVLPLPQHGEDNPWWPGLAGQAAGRLSILARLPCVTGGGGPESGIAALVVGHGAQDATGDDHSFLVIESTGAVSGGSLSDMLDMVGLTPVFFTNWAGPVGAEAPMFLAEVADYVALDDARVDGFREGAGEAVRGISVIGGFATPIEVPGDGA
ncbi:MAG: chorismate mutase [Alphaproteobacteria bacterium]